MLYFSHFSFDPQALILYKNGEAQSLNINQAKLLALFLENPNRLLSKEDILATVWARKIMSDQVVFQTISQLRAILGEDVIKTFPKRGYQWLATISNTPSQNIVIEDKKAQRLSRNTMFIFVLLCVSCGLIYQFAQSRSVQLQSNQAHTFLNWRLIPFESRDPQSKDEYLVQLNASLQRYFKPVELASGTQDAWQFLSSPYMKTQSVAKSGNSVLISGVIYPASAGRAQGESQYVLNYVIQGPIRRWQGFIFGSTFEQIDSTLVESVRPLSTSNFLNESSEAAATAELELLVNQNPDNIALLQHLIARQIEQSDYDTADAQIAKLKLLAKAQSQPVYEAYAFWLKGNLLIELEQYDLALTQLERAQNKLQEINLLAMQSEVSKSQADVAAAKKDFVQIQRYLLQSASQARLANRPTQEVRAYTLLSIKAAKLKLDKEKYDYLQQAELLIDDYQLDDSHRMLTDYHWALFAQSKSDKVSYYERVLARPITPDNFWVFFSVSEKLIHYAIEEQNWARALTLAKNITDSARQSFLLTQIYTAKQELEKAKLHAENAFNLARTQGIDWVGLDMALALLELHQNDASSAQVMLSKRYILNTAKSGWLKKHKARLQKVGVELNTYIDKV